MKVLKHLSFLALWATSIHAYAQEEEQTCGFDALLQTQLDVRDLTREDLETQMQSHMAQYERFQLSEDNTIYKIPVVFHVLHLGEPEGEGKNISTARILEQIRITNEQLRRRNTNIDIEPPAFRAVAADVGIEVVLAKTDPDGLPTSGIVRKEIPPADRDKFATTYVRRVSAWPDKDYMNVWVTPFNGGFLGLATLPFFPDTRVGDLNRSYIGNSPSPYGQTPVIPGLHAPIGLNGIILAHIAVGSVTTLVHEIGHFLGLYHMWGGGGCDRDDFCADTPNTSRSNRTGDCGAEIIRCGSSDMFQNYMDYTQDRCQSMFTQCQKQRMRTVLRFTAFRNTLLRSPGLSSFATRPLDLGIRRILSPRAATCDNQHRPSVEVINYGDTPLNEYTLELYVNSILRRTVTVREALPRHGKDTVFFYDAEPLRLGAGHLYTFSFRVKSINGATDTHTANNELSIEIPSHRISRFPLVETFDNPDNIRWSMDTRTREKIAFVDLPKGGKILKFPFYNDAAAHEAYTLTSPYLAFAENTNYVLRFRYSYTAHEEAYDFLGVYAAQGCEGLHEENKARGTSFRLYGLDLQTSLLQASGQDPAGLRDWKEAEISLSRLPRTGTQLYIIAISDAGNNIYLDDLRIEEHAPSADRDLGIASIHTLPVTCADRLTHLLSMRNYGSMGAHVRDAEITTSLSSRSTSLVDEQPTVNPGEQVRIWERGNISIDKGAYALSGNITWEGDNNPDNNERTTYVYKTSRSTIPVPSTAAYDPSHRDEPSAWDFYNPDKPSDSWEIAPLEENGRMRYPLKADFFNSQVNASYWLMSPLYDFSDQELEYAWLSFKVSYAARQGRLDRLSIVAIKDCGLYVDTLLYSKAGLALSKNRTSEERWQPTSDVPWISAGVDLSQYLGRDSKLQLALIATSDGGNAIFIDDIHLRIDMPPPPEDEEEPILEEPILEEPLHTTLPPAEHEAVVLFPNPSTGELHLRFKLQQRQDIVLSLSDETGKSVWKTTLKDVQQETTSFMPVLERQKLYILRIEGSAGFSTLKRYIHR